jgi:hypothetical protein
MPPINNTDQNLDLGLLRLIPIALCGLASAVCILAVVYSNPLSVPVAVAVLTMLASVVFAWGAGSVAFASSGKKASAVLLAAAYIEAFLSATTVFTGAGWWGVAGGFIATTAALVATGFRSLRKPARCKPSALTLGMLGSIKTVNWSPATGVGGGLPLCSDSAGRLSLVGEVTASEGSYEDSVEFEEFTALLQRVRKSTGVGEELAGVVVLAGVNKFGPLHVKGSESVTVCSVNQLPKALVRKQRR